MFESKYDLTRSAIAAGPTDAGFTDVRAVISASELLQIGEFRLFQLAYAHWFGRAVEEKTIEPQFVRYMFQHVVPGWVRHFARAVIERAHQGRLDPTEFGLSKPSAQVVEAPDMTVVRACNDIMLALWFAGAYAIWSYSGF